MSWLNKISYASGKGVKNYLAEEDLSSYRQLLEVMVFMMSRFVPRKVLSHRTSEVRQLFFQELNLSKESIKVVEDWLVGFYESTGRLAGVLDYYNRSRKREKSHDQFLLKFIAMFPELEQLDNRIAKWEFAKTISLSVDYFTVELSGLAAFTFSLEDSEEELRRKYKKHVLASHPDKGGSAEDFARLKQSFDFLISRQSVLH